MVFNINNVWQKNTCFFVRSTPLYCINYYFFVQLVILKKSNHETRAIYFLHAYFFMLPDGFSQQATTVIKPDLKYGKPSKEELSLETYAPDTTAVAVYLFHKRQRAVYL